MEKQFSKIKKYPLIMDKQFHDLIKKAIKDELGEIVSEELKIRFKPFLTIADELRKGQDGITEQLRTDRKDINNILIGQATSEKQGKVIIENQNLQQDEIVKAVKEEAKKIPERTEQAVDKILGKKAFLAKLKDKFVKKGG